MLGTVEQHDFAHWIARTIDGAEFGPFAHRGEAVDALAARGWRVKTSAPDGTPHHSGANWEIFLGLGQIPAVSHRTTEKGERLFREFLNRARIFRRIRDFNHSDKKD